jgi:hypothetical protein
MFHTVSDFTLLDPETIYLDPEDIQEASQISPAGLNERSRWRSYIHRLAVLGLQRWLQARLKSKAVDIQHSTFFEPGYVSFLDATCNIRIGEFKTCVISTENIIDGIVKIPQAAVEIPELTPHFYLIIEVIEEQEELIFRGLLRSDQFQNYRQSMNLEADQDWWYRVPLPLFEREPSRLVFYTEHIDVIDLPLPESSSTVNTAVMTADDLRQVLSEISMTIPLWQQLSWAQAASILKSPELRSEFHRWQQRDQDSANSPTLRAATEAVRQGVINVSQWLETGLDELAQSVGFVTGSQLQFASTMRSQPLSEVFEGAIATLREDGLPIPDTSRPLYRNVELEEFELCVCLLPYRPSLVLETSAETNLDWSLLVIVGSQLDQPLPAGLRLQIRCGNDILEAITLEFEEVLVYSSVDAKAGETLQVEIIAPSGTPYSLPALTYDAGA